MIKRTIFISSACDLHAKLEQLQIRFKESVRTESVPLEDIGILMVENRQCSISTALLDELMQHNVAVIFCDQKFHPSGMMYPFSGGHHQMSLRHRYQLEAPLPLKKQLWQQITQSKIRNQARVLKQLNLPYEPMLLWASKVKSGDPENLEGRAAAHYWAHIFKDHIHSFTRDPEGNAPNSWLNYLYALIRAAIARAIAGAGLLPVLGIHHRNQYNAFCLADDLMEPYRPIADYFLVQAINQADAWQFLDTGFTPELKRKFLEIFTQDVLLKEERSPLLIATQRTAYSLAACFQKEKKTLLLPELYEIQ